MNQMRNWLKMQNSVVIRTALSCYKDESIDDSDVLLWTRERERVLSVTEKYVCKIEQRPLYWHVFNFLLFGIPGLREVKLYRQQLEFEAKKF